MELDFLYAKTFACRYHFYYKVEKSCLENLQLTRGKNVLNMQKPDEVKKNT